MKSKADTMPPVSPSPRVSDTEPARPSEENDGDSDYVPSHISEDDTETGSKRSEDLPASDHDSESTSSESERSQSPKRSAKESNKGQSPKSSANAPCNVHNLIYNTHESIPHRGRGSSYIPPTFLHSDGSGLDTRLKLVASPLISFEERLKIGL